MTLWGGLGGAADAGEMARFGAADGRVKWVDSLVGGFDIGMIRWYTHEVRWKQPGLGTLERGERPGGGLAWPGTRQRKGR